MTQPASFQERVREWIVSCFGPKVSDDKIERGDRLLEEVLELLQSGDYPAERAAAMIPYVYDRAKGEPVQELGGVMVCLAAYCHPHNLDMDRAGETELSRIWTKMDKIRSKQAVKPTGAALTQERTCVPRKWTIDDRVRKSKGSSWHGRVCGFYSTELTPVGYCVESTREPGSVQLYPEQALETIL